MHYLVVLFKPILSSHKLEKLKFLNVICFEPKHKTKIWKSLKMLNL